MPKCIIYTYAYNAEKTLQRTVESVLAQTHNEFLYYLVNNGSTDNTGELIREFAKQDSRIVPLSNKQNHVWEKGTTWWSAITGLDDTDFLCFLDSDDEYKTDFLIKILAFAAVNKLDLAVCGHDLIDENTNHFYGSRVLAQDLIVENDGFSAHFPSYHPFMRTMWGKLYRVAVLRRIDFSRTPQVPYGGDTFFALESFRNASRVGILSQPLYKYYLSLQSVSHQFDPQRSVSDQMLHSATLEFLHTKCGNVSEKNMDFLFGVYRNAITDTLRILLSAKMPASQKFDELYKIFTHEHTRNLASHPDHDSSGKNGMLSKKRELFLSVAQWMLTQKEAHSDNGFALAVDILSIMRVFPSDLPGWHNDEKFSLLLAVREKVSADPALIDTIDIQLALLLKSSPILIALPIEHAAYLNAIVSAVLRGDHPSAIDSLFDLANSEIPDEYAESYIILGQNVCAAAEYADGWIFFKRLWVEFLIEQSRKDEAEAELRALEELFPGDESLEVLRMQL